MWYDVSRHEVIKGKSTATLLLLLLTRFLKGSQIYLNTTCSDDTKFIEDVTTQCACVYNGHQVRWVLGGIEANATGRSPLVVTVKPKRQHHLSTGMCIDDESGRNKSFAMNVEYAPSAVSVTCTQKRPWRNGTRITCTCSSEGGNPQPSRLVMYSRLLAVQGLSPLLMKLVATSILNGNNITCISIVGGRETVVKTDYRMKIAFGETNHMKIINDGAKELDGGVFSVQYNRRAFMYCMSGSSYPPTSIKWNHKAQDKTTHLLTSSGGVISVRRVSVLSKRRESLLLTCFGSNVALDAAANKSVIMELIGPSKTRSTPSTVDLNLFLYGFGGFVFGLICTLAVGAVLSHVTTTGTSVTKKSHNKNSVRPGRITRAAKSNNARRPPPGGHRRCHRPRYGRSMQGRHRPRRRRQRHRRKPRKRWESRSSSSSTSSSTSYLDY